MEISIINRMKEEHALIFFLLEDIENCPTLGQKAEHFNNLKTILVPHLKAEDKAVFQKLETLDNSARNKSHHLCLEHHDIRDYIQRLNLIPIDSPQWDQMYHEFKEFTERHCAEEEALIFPEAKEDFSRYELIEIGEEFEESKHLP